MRPLEGIIIPAITPFDETGALRLDYLKNNYELWNKTCVQGYMALGSNGEFRSLDDDEAFAVLKAASEAAAPDTMKKKLKSQSRPKAPNGETALLTFMWTKRGKRRFCR